jgi:hypothetical protein
MWHLQQGRQEEAREDLVAALALARNVSRDGTLISTLVQQAMELILSCTIAENFGRFSPATLQELAVSFEAAPPRGSVATSIAAEKRFFHDWLVNEIERLQQEHPGNETEVLTRVHGLFVNLEESDREKTNPDQDNVWTQLTNAAGGTSEGIVRLLREEAPLYARLAEISALPYAEYGEAASKFRAEVQASSHPLITRTLPAMEKARRREFRALTFVARVRAAIEYKLRGEAGLQLVADPCGTGPFGFRRFMFEGRDRGFELKSAYQGDFPEVLIFVEGEGTPYRVDGPQAGKALPETGPKK